MSSRAWVIPTRNPHGSAICLFLAGQTGEGADGKLVPGGIQAGAEQVMLHIEAALARRGLTMEHVVKCTVFLADIDEWGALPSGVTFTGAAPAPSSGRPATGRTPTPTRAPG
jgi:2-iminobutanoate/2-iminopropanoate deaminase